MWCILAVVRTLEHEKEPGDTGSNWKEQKRSLRAISADSRRSSLAGSSRCGPGRIVALGATKKAVPIRTSSVPAVSVSARVEW
jgi:hypothetical protein